MPRGDGAWLLVGFSWSPTEDEELCRLVRACTGVIALGSTHRVVRVSAVALRACPARALG